MSLKVAMVVRDMKYGIGSHMMALIKYLQRRGVKVDLYTGHSNLGTNRLLYEIPDDYDLIHIQGSPFGAFKSKASIPRVVTVHTLLKREWQYEKRLSYLIGWGFEARTFRLADRIIAVSEHIADDLHRLYGVPYKKIAVAPNGVDLELFGEPNFENRGKFVLGVGRDVKRKDFKTLRKACEFVGLELKLFHGEVSWERLVWHYKHAMAYVCSSLYEGLPMTVLEAMACGCPVVCSNIPAVKGLVIHGQTGLLFPPRHVYGLAGTLMAIYELPTAVAEMARRAYTHVRKNYNAELMAERTLAVYQEVVE